MSCIAPTLVLDPAEAAAGSTVEVTLSDAIADCRDTGGGQVGWAEGQVEIVVRTVGETAAVATTTMDVKHGAGSAALELPGDLADGAYEVTAARGLEIPASAQLTVADRR